jgi:hypothetical protein
MGANAKCAQQYPGAHLCTAREFQWAGVGVSPGPAGFWIDTPWSSTSSQPNSFPRDRDSALTCNNWRSSDGPGEWSRYFDVQGVSSSAMYNVCHIARQLACCGG